MFLVGQPRFEPGTPSPPDLYANQLRYCPTKNTIINYAGFFANQVRYCQNQFEIHKPYLQRVTKCSDCPTK